MKKVLGLAISFCMLFGTVFAKGVYSGDVQLRLGLGLDSAKAKADIGFASAEFKAGATMVDFDVSTWHLFDVNDLIGVGFNLGCTGGIGKTNKLIQEATSVFGGSMKIAVPSENLSVACTFTGLIGPAVGFSFNDLIKLDVAAGLAYGFDLYSYEYEIVNEYSRSYGSDVYMIFGAGFGFDVQAKFFPKNVVSPVVGYSLSSIYSSKVSITTSVGTDTSLDNYWKSVNFLANEIYLGVSFNW